ncbi:MAG: peptidase S8/S53 domain-containing protein, partial [Olpidium bornovanus]
ARPNDVCGVGVAYGARIAGERLISDWPTDSDEAAAFTWYMDKNDIYSSSWGPGDDGTAVEGPGLLTQRALAEGTARGRGGRGSIYVFAAGNGRAVEDNCNFDGYANSPYTISIGAITKEGVQAYYSEECSAILAVTFSSGQGHFISTTDVGNTCTKEHSGTSAAAPLAAGVVALMLQVRPELTWRDVQHLIVEKAVVTDISDASWETNGSGRRVSHRYGFGMMDAAALVEGARRHALVPRPQLVHHAEKKACNAEIPLADDELLRVRHAVDAAAVESLTYLESVQVAVWIAHPFRGRLRIELESPSGTRSVLATERATDNSTEGYSGWKFTTVLHWGEDPVGDWFLSVVDGGGGGPPRGPAGGRPKPGVLQAWKLTFFGTCSARDAETLANGSSTCGSRKAAGEASPGAAASGRILAYVLAASLVPFAAVLLCVGRRWSTLFRRRPRGIALGGRAGSEDIGLVDRALGFRDPRAKGFRPVRGSEWSLQIPKRTASLEEVVTPLEPDREEIYRTPRTPASLAPPAPAAAAAAAGPAAGRPQPLSQPRPPPAAAVANAAHAAVASGGRHSFENPMIRSRSMTELRLLADGPESPARGPTVRKSGSTFFPLD